MADPVGIANCIFWYKADDASTVHHTANALDDWDDKSGNARDCIQTGGLRPTVNTRTLNSKNVVDVNGSSQVAFSSSFAQTQPFTLYIVCQNDDGANSTNQAVFDSQDDLSKSRFLKSSANVWAMFAGATISGGTADTTAAYFTCVFNGASSALYRNGSSIASGDVGAQTLTIGIYLGLDSSGTQWWDGTIAEAVGYAGAHDAGQRASVEAYLNTEWFVAPGAAVIRPTLIVGASQAAQRASRW